MKPEYIGSSIGVDRLATWNEVRCAMAVSAGVSPALDGDCGDMDERDSDFRGIDFKIPDEDMWLAIVCETLDFKSN
jgi:hypothetical protein